MDKVFEDRELRRIFRQKKDEITGVWRKQYNQELHNIYPSPNIIRMIKSSRLMWAGHIARMERGRINIGFW
jgi:hypothetical protein